MEMTFKSVSIGLGLSDMSEDSFVEVEGMAWRLFLALEHVAL